MLFKSLKLFWPQKKQWSRIPVQEGDQISSQVYTGALKPAQNWTARSHWDHYYEDCRLCSILGQSWSKHGFQHLAMLFYQQKSISSADSLKPITSGSLYVYAHKYYATTGRQTIVDKLARQRIFSPKVPVKSDQAQNSYLSIRIPCECCVVYYSTASLGYNFLYGHHSLRGNRVEC